MWDFHFVDPAPDTGSNVIAHVIIIQGQVDAQRSLLIKHDGLPILRKHRAVLYHPQDTVLAILTKAQCHRPCLQRHVKCSLQSLKLSNPTRYETDEVTDEPQASFMQAWVMTGDSDSETAPEDDDVQEQSSDSEASTRFVTREYDDDSEVDFEESSFMHSGGGMPPVLHSEFQQQYPFPWADQIVQQHDNEGLEEEEPDSLVFGADQEDLVRDLMDQVEDSDLNPRGRITAITYGLGIAELGRRDITFDPRNVQSFVDTIAELWHDHLMFANAEIWVVTPQPALEPAPNIVVIVKFLIPHDEIQEGSCVLVVEDSALDTTHRQRPYPTMIFGPMTNRGLCSQLGLRLCHPMGVRNCDVNMAGTHVRDGELVIPENGALVETFVHAYPEKIARVKHGFANVEEFFTRLRLIHESEHSPHHFCLRVHGISPRNQPLGYRDVYFKFEQFDNADWLAEVTQLWPFGIEQITRLAFVPQITQEHDNVVPVLHLIVNYARSFQGVPILVRQTLAEQDEGTQISELWALTTRVELDAETFRSSLQRFPFWIDHDRDVALIRDNSPLEQAQTPWRAGWVVDLRIIHYDRASMIGWRMRFESSQQQMFRAAQPIESTSFLQTQTHLSHRDPFVEICEELKTESTSEHCAEVEVQQVQPIEQNDANLQVGSGDDKEVQLLDSLKQNVQALLQSNWYGLNHDWTIFPDLHPAARVAIDSTSPCRESPNVFHIYTDGSASTRAGSTQAAWAFVVVCECGPRNNKQFCRIGYAGDSFEPSNPEIAAIEAESIALIAVAGFLMSRPVMPNLDINVHFDAKTVGFGATGLQSTIFQKITHDSKPFQARLMLSMVQKKFSQVNPIHVHGHDGNPFNELADGIARFIRCGNHCPVRPTLRCEALLQHPLREFAWMEISPTQELPSIEQVLNDHYVRQDRSWADRTLMQGTLHSDHGKNDLEVISLLFATANIGTGAYDHEEFETGSSGKIRELLYQFQKSGYDFIAVQETRAKYSRTAQEGPFIRLISAAAGGTGGVELWINLESIAEKTGMQLQVEKDCLVWHATSRILAVHLQIAGNPMDVIVAYGPQSGRCKDEIDQWWDEIDQMLRQRKSDAPIWLVGDLNAKIGEVTNGYIDSLGADQEDHAGERLRELSETFKLVIPSTFAQFHKGQHWTFIGPRGSRNRVDFFAVDERCADSMLQTGVDPSIDLLNGNRDHLVLSMTMQLEKQRNRHTGMKRVNLYDRVAARAQAGLFPIPSQLPCVDWHCHVNEHWSSIRDALQSAAVKFFPKPKRQRRQVYFSSETWDLVCQRKDLRNLHYRKQRQLRWMILNQCFSAWKDRKPDNARKIDINVHTVQLEEAMIYQQKCRIDTAFRACKKKEWKEWVKNKLQEMIEGAKNATCSEIYKILKPKAAIDKHSGKHRRPLPGLKNAQGVWCSSREQIAFEWKRQFGGIEHADDIELQMLQQPADTSLQDVKPSELIDVPSIYDLEQSIRAMQVSKATGVDNIGPELLKGNVVEMAQKLYPLLLKTIVRGQWVPELSGGWLLPLFKGKGHYTQMSGYRAILLESPVARVFSRTWRRQLEEGVKCVAQPNQWGGRRGLSCESLRLQVRTWQSNAKHQHRSLALIFMDIRQAFYTLAKPLLTDFKGTARDIQDLGQILQIPESAMEEFAANIQHSNLVSKATSSRLTAAMAEATLRKSWFVIPDGDSIQAPRTGGSTFHFGHG